MALTFHPRTGEITTTFLLEQEQKDEERQQRIDALNRALTEDAIKWRCLPEAVKKRLIKKYKL